VNRLLNSVVVVPLRLVYSDKDEAIGTFMFHSPAVRQGKRDPSEEGAYQKENAKSGYLKDGSFLNYFSLLSLEAVWTSIKHWSKGSVKSLVVYDNSWDKASQNFRRSGRSLTKCRCRQGDWLVYFNLFNICIFSHKNRLF